MEIVNHALASLNRATDWTSTASTPVPATTGVASFHDILKSASIPNETDKIKNAAKQFEGLIISQILKSVHEASEEGWMGTGSDQSGSTALDLAQEQFAQAMANGGGLGLAKMVEKGLANRPRTANSAPIQP
jgi:Rod binding domain-containing protein